MKTCFKCKIDKNIVDFRKNKHSKDGLYTYCKECCKSIEILQDNKTRCKNYRNNNIESIREKDRISYAKNRERKIEKSSLYFEK